MKKMYDENRLDIEYDSSIGEYVDKEGNIYYNYKDGSYSSGSAITGGGILLILFLPLIVFISKKDDNDKIPPLILLPAIMNMFAIGWGIISFLVLLKFLDLTSFFVSDFDRLVFFLLEINFFGITLIIIHYILSASEKVELDTIKQVAFNPLVLSACFFWVSLIMDTLYIYIDDFYGLPQFQDFIINSYNLIYYGYVVAFTFLAMFILKALMENATLFNISFTSIVAFTISMKFASIKYSWYAELFDKMFKFGVCLFIFVIFIRVCHSLFIKKN